MWPRFGIKIGESTLCIAYVKADGKVEVIANEQGDRTSAIANLLETANGNERSTSKSSTPDDDKKLKGDIIDANITLFRAELELAKQFFHEPGQKPTVVLSIPSYKPDSAWSDLAYSAEEAGFHVAQVIAEPTASLLAYKVTEPVEKSTKPTLPLQKYVLTVKSGGNCSHFALYLAQGGLYSRLAESGAIPIGGNEHTEALVNFICDEFQRKYKLDPHESRRSILKIKRAAAGSKHVLTTLPSTQIYIDSLMDGIDYTTQMSRARFEMLIQPCVTKLMDALNEFIQKAKTEHPDIVEIDEIVLLGAPMQIPKIQSILAARYPNTTIHASISADEVVAVGCARQALYLIDPTKTVLKQAAICDTMAEDLYIWHGINKENVELLLAKGSILPTTARINVKRNEGTHEPECFSIGSGNACQQTIIPFDDPQRIRVGIFPLKAKISINKDGGIAFEFRYI